MHPSRAMAYRIQVAALIEAVLKERITPRTAIHTWPMLGNEDPSVMCAYTMIWYAESDDDRVHEEVFYSDIQLDLLAQMVAVLKTGEALPDTIIREYKQQVPAPEYDDHWTWRTYVWRFRRWGSVLEQIMLSNPRLSQWLSRVFSSAGR